MCLIKLVLKLYLTVLPPPFETFTLQTLQTAVEVVAVASVKYLHTADSLARCMLLNSSSMRHTCCWQMTQDVLRRRENLDRPVDLLIFPIPDPAILSISGSCLGQCVTGKLFMSTNLCRWLRRCVVPALDRRPGVANVSSANKKGQEYQRFCVGTCLCSSTLCNWLVKPA